MKILQKYQIFESVVEISDEDVVRLKTHLTGWNHLNEIFLFGITEPDLRRLILLEIMNARRMPIINRLLGRLAKLERKRIAAKIGELFI